MLPVALRLGPVQLFDAAVQLALAAFGVAGLGALIGRRKART